MKILFLLLLSLELFSQNLYSFRVAYGDASKNNLGDIIIGDFGSYPQKLTVLNLDGGYLLKTYGDDSLDLYLKGGVSHFYESAAGKDDVYEANIYIKLYKNFDFLENRIRFGFGEGGSYTSDILYVEQAEAATIENGKTSYFLNYLDISLDFDLGRLVRYAPAYDTYIGWTLKHRSGIFGLINGVTKGGSNYNTIYIEKNF